MVVGRAQDGDEELGPRHLAGLGIVWPAKSTYAEACASQALPHWTVAHVHAFEFAAVVLLAPLLAAAFAFVGLPAAGWLLTHGEDAEKWGGRLLESASFLSERAERIHLLATE